MTACLTNFPFGQNELIEGLLKVNKNLVAVIVSGNAVEMTVGKRGSNYRT